MSKKIYNGLDAYIGFRAIIQYYDNTNVDEKREIERIHSLTKPSKNGRAKIEFVKEYEKSHSNGTLPQSLDSLIEAYKTKEVNEVVVKFNLNIEEGQDGYDAKKGVDGTIFIATMSGHNIYPKRIISFGENPNIDNVERMLRRSVGFRNMLWDFEVLVGEDESQQTDEVEKKIIKDVPIATMVSGNGSSYYGVHLGDSLEVLVDGYEHIADGHFAIKSLNSWDSVYSTRPLDGGCWQWRIELDGKPWYYGQNIYKVTVDGVDYHAVKRGVGYRLLWLVDPRRQRDMGTDFRSIITTRWDNVVGEYMWQEPSQTLSSYLTAEAYGISSRYSPVSTMVSRSEITEDDLVDYTISYDPF